MFFLNPLNFCIKKNTLHYLKRCHNQNQYTNVGVITERTFLHRHFSKRIDRIFRNSSCSLHYRFLMLNRILINFCICRENKLYYMTALSDPHFFFKRRSSLRVYFFPKVFRKRIDRIFKTCSYCIHYRFLMLYRTLLNLRI